MYGFQGRLGKARIFNNGFLWTVAIAATAGFIGLLFYFFVLYLYPLHEQLLKNKARETVAHIDHSLNNLNNQQLSNYLTELLNLSPTYSYALVMDTTAVAIAHSDPTRIKIRFFDPGFARVLTTKKTVEQVYIRDQLDATSPHHNEVTFDIMTPHFNQQGKLTRVVNVGVSLASLTVLKRKYYVFTFFGVLVWLGFMGVFIAFGLRLLRSIKSSQQSLQNVQDKFALMLDKTSDIPVTLTKYGKINYIGANISRYGFDPQTLIKSEFSDLIDRDDKDRVLINHNTLWHNGENQTFIFKLNKPDANIWIEENVCLSQEGSSQMLLGSLRDITHRIELANRLWLCQKQLHAILDTSRDLIFTCDINGNITDISKVAQEVCSRTKDQALGLDVTKVAPLLDIQTYNQVPNLCLEAVKTGKASSINQPMVLLGPTGRQIKVVVACMPLLLPTGHAKGAILMLLPIKHKLT